MALEEGARDAEEDSSRPIGPVVGQFDSNLQRGGAPACLKDLIEAGRRDSAL